MMIPSLTLFLILFVSLLHDANSGPCDIVAGRNELILDVRESIGEEYNQTINPEELPIEGNVSDIKLGLSEEGKKRFTVDGKSLKLLKPLDRDQDNLSILRFEIICSVTSSTQSKSIPVVLRIQDVNDNPPKFVGAPYEVSLKEDVPVNSPIFKGIRAVDLDSGRNGQVEYEILDISPKSNNSEPIFSIRFPHQGIVFLASPLDYETAPVFHLTVLATDHAEREEDRLNSTTTLTVRVEDVDDQDPVFDTAKSPSCSEKISPECIPQYHSSVVEGKLSGALNIYPSRIHAKDPDSIGASILYTFESGLPSSFSEYFKIDPRSAVVTQTKIVDRATIKNFEIIIQALEKTARRGKAIARLKIDVQGVDTSPPKLVIPSYSGKVLEASIPGTPVLRDDGSELPFALSVTDPDLRSGETSPRYVFELTTSAFEVNKDGILVVASPNLDRDPPSLSEHTFQVIAREDREGGAASSPVTLTVRLKDINDNPPRLPVLPTVTVPAGSEKRSVVEVEATDADEGANAVVHYELVSGGKEKFSIDSKTGLITAEGNLEAGETFFLHLKATDVGNLTSEGFLDIIVSKGPNTNGPIFLRSHYLATIPEDIAHGGRVLAVEAKDPEGDTSYYSISGGDGSKSFEIDTLTGLITVVAPLDRETKREYQLEIMAEDSERKSNTANVLITVTDVNDEAPSFVGEPYAFRVDEGVFNASVGTVKAEDRDLEKFGEVSYMIEEGNSRFRINSTTGEIFTNVSLDYEKEQAHSILVVAHDMASDPRSTTTTVQILVNDLKDENPIFDKASYDIHVPENTDIGSVITTVVAKDKDTVPSVTYKMIEGDSHLFKIASDTGRITVAGNLDYETKANYTLVIGTEENTGEGPGARTKVLIYLEDVNDMSPLLLPLHTVTFPKSAPVNALLASIVASDADGSSPNNQIKYTFSEATELTPYLTIDPEKGEIRLKKLLKDANFTEASVKLKATDGGDPALFASGEFRVLLLEGAADKLGEAYTGLLGTSGEGDALLAQLASSPRFSKHHFEIEVTENTPLRSVIVRIPLINTTLSISCSILYGNEEDVFETRVTKDGNCKVLTKKDIDYEITAFYNLTLILHPVGFTVGENEEEEIPVLSEATVIINVIDVNDNSPTFLLKDFNILENYPQHAILSFALETYPVDTKVIELRALDFDYGQNDTIEYTLLPESNRGNYFSIGEKSGSIYTKRELENVPLELQPFNLSVVAKDRPGILGNQHTSKIYVIIPVIEDYHRSVLVLEAQKSDVSHKIHLLTKVLSESTGHTVQIEQLKHEKKSSTSSTNGHKSGPITEVWFHLLDKKTLQPLVPHVVSSKKENEKLLHDVTTSFEEMKALKLVSAAEVMEKPEDMFKSKSIPVLESSERERGLKVERAMFGPVEYVLLVLACIIILFVFCAIIIVCALWSRFSRKWNVADKTMMLIPPIIDRPGSVLESVSKEYEVQVLHMSVPLDDDSVHDVTVESDSPRQFCLDNVSYISKSQTGLGGSSSGGSSGMVTPSGISDTQNGTFPRWSPETPSLRGNYDPFVNEPLNADPNGLSVSATNENVLFGRRGFADPSPVETTTEL